LHSHGELDTHYRLESVIDDGPSQFFRGGTGALVFVIGAAAVLDIDPNTCPERNG
jgi:hypothetical protein